MPSQHEEAASCGGIKSNRVGIFALRRWLISYLEGGNIDGGDGQSLHSKSSGNRLHDVASWMAIAQAICLPEAPTRSTWIDSPRRAESIGPRRDVICFTENASGRDDTPVRIRSDDPVSQSVHRQAPGLS
jgi:hypothetical protein